MRLPRTTLLAFGSGLAFAGVALAAPAGVTPFRYADLERLIRDNHITTIEDLLPRLPEDYRRAYAFVYESRSSQKVNVSPEWPRVILYGDDATLIMAFTKNPVTPPAVATEDSLETIDYDDGAQAFRFRKLVFSPGHDPLAEPPEVNPPECQACHGEDPRPNWDPYNLWPGAFGGVSREGCDTMQAGTDELRYYLDFLSAGRKQDRYQFLPAEVSGPSACPADPKDELTMTNGLGSDVTAGLTQAIAGHNWYRLKRFITTSPSYQQFQFIWQALGNGCLYPEQVETYFPDGWAAAHGFRAFAAVQKDIESASRTSFAARLARFSKHGRGSSNDAARVPIDFMDSADPNGAGTYLLSAAAAITLVAERMGHDVVGERWTLPFADGPYDFTTPGSGPEELFFLWRTTPPLHDACDDLRRQSLAALGK